MSLAAVKLRADLIAEQNAVLCMKVTGRYYPNYRFFRRIAGLSGDDLNKAKDKE